MTITTDAFQGLTAPPPAAPESATQPTTPANEPAQPAQQTEKPPTGAKAVKAQEKAKRATVADRMREARQASAELLEKGPQPAAEPAPAAEATAAAPEGEAPTEAATATEPQWDEAAGRWRDPGTGNFVAAPEGQEAGPTATEVAADVPSEEAGAEETPAEDANLITVPLPNPRGGEDLAVDVDDPEVAEAVRHLVNNGMRREEFKRRMESVEQKESEQRELVARIQYAPESIVDALSPENRARFASYLLAQDFDRLLPMLQSWAENDITRQQALLYSQQQAFTSRQQFESAVATQRQERQIMRAVENLIPDHATPADADDFRQAAIARLTAVTQQGGDVRPETVAQHLDRDVRRFGFLPPADPDPSRTPSLVPTQPAPSARSAPAPADVKARADATQQRLAQVAKQRQAAAPIAPRGAGAAPATTIPRPASFAEAGKIIKNIPREEWQRIASRA